MIERERTSEKKTKTIPVRLVIVQLLIVAFFTVSLLGGLIFNVGVFNVWYFLFIFGGTIVSAIIFLISKGNPDNPLDLKYTQQIGKLIKDIVDITTQLERIPSSIIYFKEHVKKTLVWSVREAMTKPEFDIGILEEAERYILDKLSEKRE